MKKAEERIETFDTMLSLYDKYVALNTAAFDAKDLHNKAIREFSDTHTATLDGEMIGLAHKKMRDEEKRYHKLADDAYEAREKFSEAALLFSKDYRGRKSMTACFFWARE